MTISPVAPSPDIVDAFLKAVKSGTLAADFETWNGKRAAAEQAQADADATIARAIALKAEAEAAAQDVARNHVESEALVKAWKDEFANDKAKELEKLAERDRVLAQRTAQLDERERDLNAKEDELNIKADALEAKELEVQAQADANLEEGKTLSNRALELGKRESAVLTREQKVEILERAQKVLTGESLTNVKP